MNPLRLSFLVAILMCLAAHAPAQIIDVNFSGGGTTQYSAWTNLSASSYPGLSRWPGTNNWTGPAVANAGSASGALKWVAAGADGGPFFSSSSIYFFSSQQVPNTFGGTLQVSNNSPLSGLRTLVFQLQIGEATGYDFYEPSGFPALSINGGAAQAALFTNLITRYQSGTFPSPATGSNEPVYVNTWAYQWNLNPTNLSSFAINFSAVTHAQVYALRMDSTTVLQEQAVVPEPGVVSLLIIGGLVLGFILAKKRHFSRR